MLKTAVQFFVVLGCWALLVSPAAAQTPAPTEEGTPPTLLQIEREELRPGKGAAHAVKRRPGPTDAKSANPRSLLGRPGVSGPSDAWF